MFIFSRYFTFFLQKKCDSFELPIIKSMTGINILIYITKKIRIVQFWIVDESYLIYKKIWN